MADTKTYLFKLNEDVTVDGKNSLLWSATCLSIAESEISQLKNVSQKDVSEVWVKVK